MAKRRVIRGGNQKFKQRALLFLGSFTSPNRFKRYWFNQDGAKRAGKIAAAGFAGVLLMFLYFAKDLPSPGKINARIGSQNTEFYDRTGREKIFELHGDKNRKVIQFNEMSDNIKKATIAIEDKDFYKHGAFSVQGIGRAFTGVVTGDRSRGGGSTITQQYVKNALLSPEYTYTRKAKELILAIEIEQLYKKDDILKLYLNEIPYGSQAYGVESACQTYFRKNLDGKPQETKCASTLSLSQASLLAAMPQLPTYYSPYGQNVDALIARQHTVLDAMTEQKMISKEEAEGAKIKGEPTLTTLVATIGIEERPRINTAANPYPHFSQYTKQYLEKKYGIRRVEEGGLKVITSIDIEKQKAAQEAVSNGIGNVRRLGGSNVALVSADPKTGQVLAMLGSYDANDEKYGEFNVALANRQPGSSFKPIVYATAMGKNWGAGSTLYDVQTDFGNYKPKNYTNRTYGVQSVRTALAGSLNIPAVKMLHIAGIKNSIQQAEKMGITTLNKPDPTNYYGLSLVLGSGEVKLNDMVNAYEVFANGGTHYDSTPVLKITDPNGKEIENNEKPKGKKALDAQVAYIISDILSDNRARAFAFGSNNPLVIPGRTVAAKTGTTENYNDAWTMGYTPDLVTGVWAGNNDNKPMSAAASTISAPIWNAYMREALQGVPDKKFDRPAGVKEVTVDAVTGRLPTNATRQRRTDLFPSWYKPQNVSGSRTERVDRVSGKLATECTPEAAVETVSTANVSAEVAPNDPQYRNWQPPVAALARSLGYSAGGGGVIPTERDDAHSCDDAKPTVSLSATDNGGGQTTIRASVVSGKFPANKLTVYMDDQVISTQELSGNIDYQFNYDIPPGSHALRAVVTDTGYYSATDDTTVTVAQSGTGGARTSPFQSPQSQQPRTSPSRAVPNL